VTSTTRCPTVSLIYSAFCLTCLKHGDEELDGGATRGWCGQMSHYLLDLLSLLFDLSEHGDDELDGGATRD
jgi:hypothetical protein